MKKTLLGILVALLGLIALALMSYGLTAFVLYESNPALWGESSRMIVVFCIIVYLCFSGLIVHVVRESL